MRKWLRLLRIHTLALTFPITALGYVLATNRIDWMLAPIFLFSLFLHAGGFLQNNVCDYERDRRDAHKKHFPLVTGEIKFETACWLCFALLGACFALGLLLSNLQPWALFFLALIFVAGTAYNASSKKTLLAPIPIAVCFTSPLLFTYFSQTSRVTPLVVLAAAYVFLQILFQISYSGYWKDLLADKVNLLRKLGARVKKNTFLPSKRSRLFAWLLKTPAYAIALAVWTTASWGNWVALVCLLATLFVTTIYVGAQTTRGAFKPKRVTTLCSLIEVMTYFALVFALASVLGWTGVAFFLVFPLAWFTILNVLTWGRGRQLAPAV